MTVAESGKSPSHPAAVQDGESALPHSLYNWYVVTVLIILLMFAYLDRQIIILLIDPIRHDLGISDVQISLLTGFAFAVFFAVCGLPLGWAADRFNRRWLIFWSVIFWGLATAACGLARSFVQLFLGRMAVGIGEASLMPASYSIISDLFPPARRAFAIGAMAIGSPLGMGLSFLIAGTIASFVSHGETVALPFLGEIRAWQAAFIAVGLPGPILAFLVLTIKEPQRISQVPTATDSVNQLQLLAFLKSHWQYFSLYTAGYGILGMTVYAIQTWAPIYLMRVFDWDVGRVGPIFGGVVAVSIVAGLLIGGAVVDYFYSRGMKDAHTRIYAVIALLCTPLLPAAVVAHNAWIFLSAVFLLQLAMNSYASAGFAAMQIITPNKFRARITAIFLFVSTMAGLGIGPLVVAMLTQYVFMDEKMVGWSLALSLAVIYPIAATLFWYAAKHMRRIHAQAAYD